MVVLFENNKYFINYIYFFVLYNHLVSEAVVSKSLMSESLLGFSDNFVSKM